MIPPLPQVRSQTIKRWMQENRPQTPATPQRIASLDSQMTQAFVEREDGLIQQMMQNQTWGKKEPMQEFQTARLELWSEVASEFLPVTSDLSLAG